MDRQICLSTHLIGESTTIVTVGIDLAKNVVAVQGVDKSGKPALVRPEVPRAKLLGVEVRFQKHDSRPIQCSRLVRGNRVFLRPL
jgi:hypothetical protein